MASVRSTGFFFQSLKGKRQPYNGQRFSQVIIRIRAPPKAATDRGQFTRRYRWLALHRVQSSGCFLNRLTNPCSPARTCREFFVPELPAQIRCSFPAQARVRRPLPGGGRSPYAWQPLNDLVEFPLKPFWAHDFDPRSVHDPVHAHTRLLSPIMLLFSATATWRVFQFGNFPLLPTTHGLPLLGTVDLLPLH